MDKEKLIADLDKVGQDEIITISGTAACTSVTGNNISAPITLIINAKGLSEYLKAQG